MKVTGLRFLGVGNAWDRELGNPSAVIEFSDDNKSSYMMIDCGSDALQRFQLQYGQGLLPDAIYLTHVHLDHIAGLETLFIRAYLNEAYRGKIRLYVPVSIMADLHARMASHPHPVAEKGVNFWEVFHLVPVEKGFWFDDYWFDVTPARHHYPDSAYGLALKGHFLFTGDTRPIPEVLNRFACHGECIFHDCSLRGNPSHSGVEDIEREYTDEFKKRLILYHYEDKAAARLLVSRGFNVATAGQRYECQNLPKEDAARCVS